MKVIIYFNPVALRKAKIVHNFGLSECNRVKHVTIACPEIYTRIIQVRGEKKIFSLSFNQKGENIKKKKTSFP